MTKGEIAQRYFESGYNCSQAVAAAFCEEMNMPAEVVARLTIGFGGGMGRMREVCGTVSGAAFVLSALYGDSEKSNVYKMVQEVAGEFKQLNGSIVCKTLLGLDDSAKITPIAEARTPQYYKKRPCGELVHQMADILEGFIAGQS